MRNKWSIFILILTGSILLTGYAVSGTYGLGEKEKNLYKEALAVQSAANAVGFPNFFLDDYPVAFYDGMYEYVLKGNDDIKKREPVINVLAATAYPVEGHMEILVPSYKNLKSIVSLALPGALLPDEGIGAGNALMVGTIWHEAFHAWQLTFYQEHIADWGTEADFDHSRIDDHSEIRHLYENELELLQLAVLEENDTKIEAYIRQICDLEEKRREMLPKDIYGIEIKTELMEGSARYMESQMVRSLCGEPVYNEMYIHQIKIYREGRDKYYTLGMAKCLLLDKLDPSWKNEFDLSKSFTEMLELAIDE